MTDAAQKRLKATRAQILAFRRRVGALDERLPLSARSLRVAAWAGAQDSMPRAALLSLHARVEGVGPLTWADRSLAQLWGPRYNTYVVPKRDFALFSIARLPESGKGRERAERVAKELHARLGGDRMTDREAARGLGWSPRYAALTGTVAIRWEGARAPLVWSVPPPTSSPADARRGLARRYLRVFGPTTADCVRALGRASRSGTRPPRSIRSSANCSPCGRRSGTSGCSRRTSPTSAPGWPRTRPRACSRAATPTGCSTGPERELLVPRAEHRPLLWTPRVWPGALLVAGEIRGTWRRAHATVRIEPWGRLSRAAREAVEAEAAALPLPDLDREIEIVWGG